MAKTFVDGPTRWYARRGNHVLSGSSQIDVLSQLWDQDAASLGIKPARLASSHDAAPPA
jgi:hypothetical protein